MNTFSLAFSPCPNDTFMFYALVHSLVNSSFDFDSHLMDIEQLNLCALEQKYDITKMSCLAFGKVTDKYMILRSGAALGNGVGPLLLSRHKKSPQKNDVIAIPGKWTTAHLLLKICLGENFKTKEYSFEDIMPAICRGDIDYGIVIHEGRFTYQNYGLHKICDLGDLWEKKSSFPIPLGIIAIKRSLGVSVAQKIEQDIQKSILFANTHRDKAGNYINQNAQEMEKNVISSHIDLYVNEHSRWLNRQACESIKCLLKAASELDLIPKFSPNLFVEDN